MKTITITDEQAEALEGLLKARIHDVDFRLTKRYGSAAQKQMYVDYRDMLDAVLDALNPEPRDTDGSMPDAELAAERDADYFAARTGNDK